MKTMLIILACIPVLYLSYRFIHSLSSRIRITGACAAAPGACGDETGPKSAPARRDTDFCARLQIPGHMCLDHDEPCKLDAESKIQQLFLPFAGYLDELLGVNDIAVIIADHGERQCVLLKRNGIHLDVMKLDYEHAIVRMMCDLGSGEARCADFMAQPDDGAGLDATPCSRDCGAAPPAPAETGGDTDALDESDGDPSRELRLINDLYRIAVNKYNRHMQLRKLSEIDDLTGLSNHRHFQEQLDQEIKIAQRLDRPLSIIFMDIDHFKTVNDTYGHQSGDLVLSELARVARGKLRGTDQIARYGGEEFAVTLPGTGKRPACEVAERLREAVEQHPFTSADNHPLRITISMGVSDLAECSDKHSLIQAADQALYRAKQAGRNMVMV